MGTISDFNEILVSYTPWEKLKPLKFQLFKLLIQALWPETCFLFSNKHELPNLAIHNLAFQDDKK